MLTKGKRIRGQLSNEHDLRIFAGERRFANEQFVEHTGKTVDVAARIDSLAARYLLWTHVPWRSDDESRLGEALLLDFAHGQRNPEIGDYGAPVLKQDVFGLDVAVYDAMSVRVVERSGHFYGQSDRFRLLETAFAIEALAERLAFDVWGDQIQKTVCFVGVEQRQDVRMRQLGGNLDLAQESSAANHGGHFGAKHLDGDVSIVLDAAREVHGRTRTTAELALDLVGTLYGASEHIAEA